MAGFVAIVAAVASLVFVAVQTRIQRATAELTLNFDIMKRLDDALVAIASDQHVEQYVWATTVQERAVNDKRHALLQTLIDPLEMALTASRRLPVFRKNRDDWHDYVGYVADNSAAFRRELHANPHWWPHLAEFVSTRRP
jgi:hypothetical protein